MTTTSLGAAWSGPLTGIAFVAGLGGAMARSDQPFPRPGSSDEQTRTYFAQSTGAPWISVAGQLTSTVALARFTRAAAEYADGSGSRRLRAAARAGGSFAAASLGAAALTAASLAGGRGRQKRPAAVARRAFVAGGPIHGVGFGLLVGALGLAGVRRGDLPRPLAIAGVTSGAVNVLSPLYFVAEPAGWLIPIGRFSGYAVIAIAASKID